MSKHSSTIDEFYATSQTTAEWLLSALRDRYQTDGKTALEPCVGGFIFPDNAPELRWTTNDLNRWTDRDPDTVQDFLEADFGRFDFIITNPPFGSANKLAYNFLKKSTSICDVVAMVVPSSMGSVSKRIHNAVPKDFKLVFSERCPDQSFDLPDGTKRQVRTHGIIWERVNGYIRPAPKDPVRDVRTPFFFWDDNGEYAIRVYGDGIGDMKPWDETCGKTWRRFSIRRQKQIIALKLLMSFPWRFTVGSCGKKRAPWNNDPGVVPAVTTTTLLHWTNCLAVLEGRIDPLEGVDYDLFLEEVTEQLLAGLSVPCDS